MPTALIGLVLIFVSMTWGVMTNLTRRDALADIIGAVFFAVTGVVLLRLSLSPHLFWVILSKMVMIAALLFGALPAYRALAKGDLQRRNRFLKLAIALFVGSLILETVSV